ncbi:MAG: SRPBCC family protein [Acidimicrobiales bacterium]
MMIAEASVMVDAPLERVREAVLDPNAYIQGGTKIQEMIVESRQGDQLVARINGHLGPFRSHIRARYTVAERSVDLEMLWGRLRNFHAVFLMEPGPEGVRLTHREEYGFGYGPLAPLLDRDLRRWARLSVEAEVRALKLAAESVS